MYLLALTVALTLGQVSSQVSNNDQIVGDDGRTYYTSQLTCTVSSLFRAGREYNTKTKAYVLKDDVKCCTHVSTRNSCCMDSSTGPCKCDSEAVCAPPAPSTTPATSAASSTNEPSTTTAHTSTEAPSTTTAQTSTEAPSTTTAQTSTEAPSTTTAQTSTEASSTTTAQTSTEAPSTTTAQTSTEAPSTTTAQTSTEASSTTTAQTSTEAPSTTASTESPTTTTFKSLCPKPQFRNLNGQRVTSDCPYPGTARIVPKNGNLTICNAVFTTATINGSLKSTFLTDAVCKKLVERSLTGNTTKYNIWIGDKKFPIVDPMFTLIDGPDGTAFFNLDAEYINLVDNLGSCQTSSCPFNNQTMGGLVDRSNCKVLSWGRMNTQLKQDGLYEVSVSQNDAGCSGLQVLNNPNNTLCFRATSGKNLYCSADNGAPVYCKATTNQEWILMGVTARLGSCDNTPEIKVLPYPG